MSTTSGGIGTLPCAERFRQHTIRFRPAEMLLSRYHRRGPVLRVGPYTYLLGPEANRFVFANSDLFRWREAFETLIPVDGETSLIVSDGDAHRRRRRLVQPAMHHRQVAHYVQIMAQNADRVIDRWRPGMVVDAYGLFRSAIRRSTIQALFGRRLAAEADFFGEQLQPLLDLVDSLPQTVVWKRRLRTRHWRRAVAARARVDERIYAEIAHARQASADADDHVLASLVHGRDEEGGGLSDVEVRDQIVTLIAAGYETTSASMAWAVYSMLTTPDVWERARAEVRGVLGDDPPSPSSLKQLSYLNGVVHEALRLYPPAVVSPRYVVEDFEFAGRRIPAGRLVLYSPYVTHRLSSVWPDPLTFRPERWIPGHPSHRKPGIDEFLPFGAGPHRCIGATLATTELTVMLARVLVRSTLRLPDQRIRPASFAAMRPRHGLRVQIAGAAGH